MTEIFEARQIVSMHNKGFTLIELLVVIAIIAVLAIVVVLTLNPLQLLEQSRDSTRVSDLSTLNTGLGIFVADSAGSGSLGTASTSYVSIPDSSATSSAGDQCQGLNLPALASGWTYQCSSPSNFKRVDGTGWIPVNFTKISSGAPFGTLPTDPTDNSSTGLYYTYTTDGQKYELTALMESQKQRTAFNLSPSNPLYPGLYAQGVSLALSGFYNPSGLAGYWNFEEGGGSSTIDQSGNGNVGAWVGASGGMSNTHYTSGRVGNYGGFFDGTTNAMTLLNQTLDMGTSDFSISAWIKTPSNAAYEVVYSKGCCTLVGYALGINTSHQIDLGIDSVSNLHVNGTTNVTDNTWHFIAVSVSRAGLATFYLDGNPNGSGNVSAQSSTITNGLTASIGALTGNSFFFSGSIDDVRLYNRAISAAEVEAIYNSEK
jgi:prepilin-type N-terminal cleavage/methylation domain-containing protein